MEVTEKEFVSDDTAILQGDITSTNFLHGFGAYQVPVPSDVAAQVSPGDTIKTIFYVDKAELLAFVNQESNGFVDKGASYFIKEGDSWSLLAEEDPIG